MCDTVMCHNHYYRAFDQDDIEDIDRLDENYLYIQKNAATGKVDWRMSKANRGTLCKGPLSAIKGAIPTIQNLARVRPLKDQCGLTTIEKEVIQRLMRRNSTCTYDTYAPFICRICMQMSMRTYNYVTYMLCGAGTT